MLASGRSRPARRSHRREAARVVFGEIYPSLFHSRTTSETGVHDELQVVAAARHFTMLDACSALKPLFEAPASHLAALQEEGWILGARGLEAHLPHGRGKMPSRTSVASPSALLRRRSGQPRTRSPMACDEHLSASTRDGYVEQGALLLLHILPGRIV